VPVDQIILMLRIEPIAAREVEQLAIDFLEVPRIGEVDQLRLDFGLRRHRGDVLCDIVRQPRMRLSMDHDEPVDPQVLVHRHCNRGSPLGPARRTELARVKGGAKEADDDKGSHLYIII
jgi:hypothetical protein